VIGLVLVSHSAALATGLAELVGQMAPAVPVLPAGGDVDGGLGTSADRVADAMAAADRGAGVVVLYDLGSARMAAELALEFVEPELADRTRLVDASFVEGAVAAGAAAAGDQSLDQVAAAAAPAAERPGIGAPVPAEAPVAGDTGTTGAGTDPAAGTQGGSAAVTERVVLTDPAGLHARPAAAVDGVRGEPVRAAAARRPGGDRGARRRVRPGRGARGTAGGGGALVGDRRAGAGGDGRDPAGRGRCGPGPPVRPAAPARRGRDRAAGGDLRRRGDRTGPAGRGAAAGG
jgi:dihydroxyacetone kinase phosphotransfer subunit